MDTTKALRAAGAVLLSLGTFATLAAASSPPTLRGAAFADTSGRTYAAGTAPHTTVNGSVRTTTRVSGASGPSWSGHGAGTTTCEPGVRCTHVSHGSTNTGGFYNTQGSAVNNGNGTWTVNGSIEWKSGQSATVHTRSGTRVIVR